MMRRTSLAAVAALIALSFELTPAQAQDNFALSDVQRAYAEVDYEGTRKLAIAALEQGENDRATTAQLYLLWGTAAAALGRPDEAKAAFVLALVAKPELKLERGVSPKVRAPYLEARGSLAMAEGKPALEVTLHPSDGELTLALHDPLRVAASLEIATRNDANRPFQRQRVPATPLRRLPLPTGTELHVVVHVLDQHGNSLSEVGTERGPRRFENFRSRAASRPSPSAAAKDDPAIPFYVTAASLAVLGVASGGFAAAMHLRREEAAEEWNGPECERAGATRGEQCATVNDRRRQAETLAIGFSAAGGALLLGSLFTVVLAPARGASPTVALTAAPHTLGVRVGGAL